MFQNMKKHKTYTMMKSLLLVMVCCILCIGCSKKEETEEYTGSYIFCLDTNENKVGFVKYTWKTDGIRSRIDECLEELQKDPSDISLKKAFPDDVRVDDYILEGNGQLTLYFNSGYNNLSGVSEILRRAAIVKTICQVNGVESVQFYVSGQPLTDSNMEAVGFMTADTFIDNTGGETTYKQQATLNMYFSDFTGKSLVEVPVDITYDATIPLEQLAIEQLIKGPYTIEGVKEDEILPTIPEGTVLNKITVKENTCYVDFSSEFLEKRRNISEEVAIYSIVNTLAELSNISKVQFSINGEQVLLYNDNIDLGSVFERNLDIVKH